MTTNDSDADRSVMSKMFIGILVSLLMVVALLVSIAFGVMKNSSDLGRLQRELDVTNQMMTEVKTEGKELDRTLQELRLNIGRYMLKQQDEKSSGGDQNR